MIEKGRICEIGSHAELLAKPGGHYLKLCALQDLSANQFHEKPHCTGVASERNEEADHGETGTNKEKGEEMVNVSKEKEKQLAKKASIFGEEDAFFFLVGGAGALLTGVMVRFSPLENDDSSYLSPTS